MKTPKSMQDTYHLNQGGEIPCIGYGTYKTYDEQTVQGIKDAVESGYRLIDTAWKYENEKAVGLGIAQCGVPREALFLTTKVWNTERGYDKATACCNESLSNLGVEYIDLLLVHWPANKMQYGEAYKDLNADTWRAFEDLQTAGKVKYIGVSNFMEHHLEELHESALVTPCVDQIEIHPGWAQKSVVEYCREKGIVVEAWSPLGRGGGFKEPVLMAIAEKYGKSVAQICLRWEIQNGVIPIPKASSRSRIEDNRNVFDFSLTQEEMDTITGLTKYLGGNCAVPDEVDF